jgi:hypothetical protein
MFTWLFRLLIGVAVVSGALWLVRAAMKWWVDGPDVEPSAQAWPRLVELPAFAEAPAAAPVALAPLATLEGGWVTPDDGSDVLTSYPVKAKESSRLYHLPGMLAYDRTRPDRCYLTPEAAEADGFVRAKR